MPPTTSCSSREPCPDRTAGSFSFARASPRRSRNRSGDACVAAIERTAMIELPIYNQSGEKVDTFKLDEAKLGGEVRKNLLKQALVMYHANQRQGTVRTLARGEVAGSTRKMFRQKGTGNARTGGIRNPIKKGGGHAKQKRPKDWRQALPKKAKRLATQSALLSKFQSGDVRVISEIKLDAPKTKQVAKFYKSLGLALC